MRHELEFSIKDGVDRMAVNYLFRAWKNGWFIDRSVHFICVFCISSLIV